MQMGQAADAWVESGSKWGPGLGVGASGYRMENLCCWKSSQAWAPTPGFSFFRALYPHGPDKPHFISNASHPHGL